MGAAPIRWSSKAPISTLIRGRCSRPAASAIALAAGENALGDAAFDALIASRAVAVVQPDLAKWGGVSGVLAVIDRIEAAGLRYCPHYLGAGVGLLASAHVLAARAGADRWLEVDANPNPLRTLLCPPLATLRAAPPTPARDAVLTAIVGGGARFASVIGMKAGDIAGDGSVTLRWVKTGGVATRRCRQKRGTGNL